MADMLVPDARFRSPTAAAGLSDALDGHVYSAINTAHGGNSQARAFIQAQGGAVAQIKGSAIAATDSMHNFYSLQTTNLVKAGEVGSGIGEISVRSIGLTIEPTSYTQAGVAGSYGATAQEAAEILNKINFSFKVGKKTYIEGPTFLYPALGGMVGSTAVSGATAGSPAAISLVQNGVPGNGRRLKAVIGAARNDTIEGLFQMADNETLTYRTTSGIGASTLVWAVLFAAIAGDVR